MAESAQWPNRPDGRIGPMTESAEWPNRLNGPNKRRNIVPNCFTLTRKSNLEAGPVPLNTIDAEMCQFFNEPVDPKRWYHNWYNVIGFDLAMGTSFEQMRADYLVDRVADDPSAFDAWTKLIEIVDWLNANFTKDSWYETKRA